MSNTTVRPRSAQRLLAIVKRYQEFEARISKETPPPMGEISFNLLTDRSDRLVLARWTNPGERSNYFIPLKHVRWVAEQLNATQAEADELMVARLNELNERGDETGAVEAVSWVVDLLARAVSPEEALLCELLRKARGSYAPEVNLSQASDSAREELVAQLRRLLDAANAAVVAENEPEPELDDEGRVAYAALRSRVVAGLAKKMNPPKRKLRGDVQASLRVRRQRALRATHAAMKKAQAAARM